MISSEPSKSGYRTTVEYTPGYSTMTVILNTKRQYESGSEVPVKYHPTSFTRVYIEGMSETGREDVKTGGIFILSGAVLSALGVFTDKIRKR